VERLGFVGHIAQSGRREDCPPGLRTTADAGPRPAKQTQQGAVSRAGSLVLVTLAGDRLDAI
jgi:hypothetical protein